MGLGATHAILAAGIRASQAALILAAAHTGPQMMSSRANHVTCTVTEAPAINVTVQTDPIKYDEEESTRVLSRVKTDTVSPYGPHADVVTGGLRVDKPEIKTDMKWSIQYNQETRAACMAYKSITVTISLHPHIYIAHEFDHGQCREAVLGHEKKHVMVDREVMNKYADIIGKTLKVMVDRTGAVGPFNIDNEGSRMQKYMSAQVHEIMVHIRKNLEQDMQERQQGVDSKAEYDRVGAYCRSVRVSR